MIERWTAAAAQDYRWLARHEPAASARIDRLVDEIRRHPFVGIGKPEALKGNLKGWWSRRIDKEHRLVYRVVGKGSSRELHIAQCRYHY